jgi:hypothetical protein
LLGSISDKLAVAQRRPLAETLQNFLTDTFGADDESGVCTSELKLLIYIKLGAQRRNYSGPQAPHPMGSLRSCKNIVLIFL